MKFSNEQLFLIFMIYSFLGYLAEVVYCRLIDGKFVNRGFLFGPICPIYGCGAILIILLLHQYFSSPFLIFVLSILITSFVEYMTSIIMEKIFKAKWWDYSNLPFNLNGRICLRNSTLFGLAAIIMVYVINPVIFKIIRNIDNNLLNIMTILLIIIFIIDIFISILISINLKKSIAIATEVKKVKLKTIPGYLEKIINDNNLVINLM